MAKKKKPRSGSGFSLDPKALFKVLVSLFFIILGFAGIIPNVDESIFSLNNSAMTLEIIFGAVELVCGLFLLASIFTFIPKKTVSLVTLIILVFWLVRIVLTKILWGMSLTGGNVNFLPSFMAWLLVLCCELIIATALFSVYSKNDR